jgi:hypothetical protein
MNIHITVKADLDELVQLRVALWLASQRINKINQTDPVGFSEKQAIEKAQKTLDSIISRS